MALSDASVSTYEAPIYPEASWIARCGGLFPSRVQWLHKDLQGNNVQKDAQIPPLSTSFVRALNTNVTVGSGMTGQGIVINEQVSLDWVTWAIGKNIWNLLYQSPKVNADSGGLVLIGNKIKEVLGVAVKEGIFSEYTMYDGNVNYQTNNASYKFKAKLTYSILNVNIEGTVNY